MTFDVFHDTFVRIYNDNTKKSDNLSKIDRFVPLVDLGIDSILILAISFDLCEEYGTPSSVNQEGYAPSIKDEKLCLNDFYEWVLKYGKNVH
jgi:acyl carrier protein